MGRMASDEAMARKASAVMLLEIDFASKYPMAAPGADKQTASKSLAFCRSPGRSFKNVFYVPEWPIA